MVPRITPPGAGVFRTVPFGRESARGIEALAATAWPPVHCQDLGGWLLRFSDGVTRRANSVLPIETAGPMAVDQRIATAERYYRGHGLPVRFQVSTAAEPEDLDDVLADRGYAAEAPTDIQIAAAEGFAEAPLDGLSIDYPNEPADDWVEVYDSGFGRDVSAILERMPEGRVFPVGRRGGEAVAIGLGCVDGGWLGIFGMQTRTELRGRGIGSAVLAGLVGWARERGAFGVYLQVERDNPGAKRLYERFGFRTVYGYHYRILNREP